MAIALESDFRNLTNFQAADPAERRPAGPGRGEEFATSLRNARDVEAGEPRSPTPDAARDALPSGLMPAEPALEVAAHTLPSTDEKIPDLGAAPDLTPGPANLPGKPDDLKSEILLDRKLVRERVEADASLPPAVPVPMDTTLPVSALDVAEPAVFADETAAPQPALRAPVAADLANHAADNPAAPEAEIATLAAVAAGAAAKSATEPAPRQAASAESTAAPANRVDRKTVVRAEPPLETHPAPASAPPAAFAALAGEGADSSPNASASGTPSPGATLIAASGPATPQLTAPPPPSVTMTPALGVLTASPAQIVDIVAQSAADGQSDRITVQLDPPELGRVSIDFKFDAQGLQHVTITSETPEAMRQLRQMHSELVQALERQGIGSQNMSFQHQQQSAQHVPAPHTPAALQAHLAEAAAGLAASALLTAENSSMPRTLSGGRLDIRL